MEVHRVSNAVLLLLMIDDDHRHEIENDDRDLVIDVEVEVVNTNDVSFRRTSSFVSRTKHFFRFVFRSNSFAFDRTSWRTSIVT